MLATRIRGRVVVRQDSARLRKIPNPILILMLQATPHAIHFKRILNFGEGQVQNSKCLIQRSLRPGVP
jgi:hypothetical protein